MFHFSKQYQGEIIYASSNLLTPLISFIASIIAAIYIIPEEMGVYQSVILTTTYCSFIHFGVFNGLNRNIAYYKSQKQETKVQLQVDTSFTVAKVVAIVGSIIGLSTLFYYIYINSNYLYIYASILLIVNLASTPIKTHFETTFRSGQEFGLLGKIIYKENILYLMSSSLPIFYGYFGKILSDISKLIFSLYFRYTKCPIRANGQGDVTNLFELTKTGFPILLSGYLWTTFVIADQTYIALNFNIKELGTYTLSRLVVTALIVIPTAINTLLYPKAASLYGKTNNAHSLRLFWKKSLIIFSCILIPLTIIMYTILPVIVYRFLPNYIEGIPSAKINILSGISFLSMGPSVIIGTLKKNIPHLIMIVILLIVFWGVGYLFKSSFSSLNTVAYFKLILTYILSTFIIIYTYYITKND